VDAEGGGRRDRKLAWTAAVARRIGPRRVLDALLRFGPHGRGLLRRRGMSLASLEASPHGVDLGPLERRIPDILGHADRRVKLAPAPFLDDARRLEAQLDAAAPAAQGGDLVLIGRRRLRSHNSWLHNSLRLVKGPAPCTLLMHPDDARARGLSDGDSVRVTSRVGAIHVPLALTDDIAPGVVSLPHGFGHHRSGAALSVAGAHAGASINDITDDGAVDPLSGNASFNGLPVSVARA
jgi:anaerobic selenocysteine-containing dehydrogenase